MKHLLRVAIVPAYLVLCLVLGGASGGGHWANMVLQLLALPLVAAGVLIRRNTPMASAGKQLMWLVAFSAALVILHLIPLPPALWTSLAGREPIARGFQMLGQPLPWLPISLAPTRTIASALWALPAVAILFGMFRLGAFTPRWLAGALISVTAVGVGLGALQLSGGETSRLYLYRIANRNAATGFFANTNNMAELMVVAIPFVAALYLAAVRKGSSVQKRSGVLIILLGALAVLVVGIAVNRSLAGIGLAVPTVAATALMIFFRGRRVPVWGGAAIVALLGASIALVLSTPFGNNLTTDAARTSQSSRYTAFGTTIEATKDYLPLGSGVGTFPQIYPMYEDPQRVDRWYMNHAHNDYLELALETGIPGLILIALFLLWWLWRVVRVWRADEPDQFARAASIGAAVILAHSFVEFPLRTAAISAVFAVCCALMAEARSRVRSKSSAAAERTQARHLSAD
ncbi:O-antigen ligase [Sphingosinicella sp. BN140058]|uniref:O-antigen ligase family protein n=1 Tax=Sphingosinicella sp. BN140058 TaxID=1892855 RepID=UPI001011DE28|nr:O-antigen ligase family protein [Sphingosinicella sp. BN140058]QAY77052.1 O-antigen ligase family protein [Sphingosinicella sp. BN140058]